MRRIVLYTFLLLFAAVVLISCEQVEETARNTKSVMIDTSKDLGTWISAGRDSSIIITGLKDDVLYAVKQKNEQNSKGIKSIIKGSTDNESGIITTNQGSNIVIPDEQNECITDGEELELSPFDEIQIYKLTSGSDYTISNEDDYDYIDSNGNKVYERYFLADLTETGFDFTEDEKKHLVLSSQLLGNGSFNTDSGVFSTNFGSICDKETELMGIMDLSDYDSVILYSYVSTQQDEFKNVLTLQPAVEVAANEERTCPNQYNVLLLDSSSAVEDTEYVMEFKMNQDLEDSGLIQIVEWSGLPLRNTDATSKSFSIPVSSSANTSDTIVFYVGILESDTLVDVWFFPYDREDDLNQFSDVCSVLLRPATEEEKGRHKRIIPDDGILNIDILKDDSSYDTIKRTQTVFFAETEEGEKLRGCSVDVRFLILDEQGEEVENFCDVYPDKYTEAYFNSSHINSYGWSGQAVYGNGTCNIDSGSILECIGIYFPDDRDTDIRIKLTFK